MGLELYSLKVFTGDTGLSVSVYSDRDTTGKKELEEVVNSMETFYKKHLNDQKAQINRKPKEVDKNSLLYNVNSSEGYVGSVKVTPKGSFSKLRDKCETEDYPIPDQTRYFETYWIYFFPEDASKRREHRDGYVNFIDPYGTARGRKNAQRRPRI